MSWISRTVSQQSFILCGKMIIWYNLPDVGTGYFSTGSTKIWRTELVTLGSQWFIRLHGEMTQFFQKVGLGISLREELWISTCMSGISVAFVVLPGETPYLLCEFSGALSPCRSQAGCWIYIFYSYYASRIVSTCWLTDFTKKGERAFLLLF